MPGKAEGGAVPPACQHWAGTPAENFKISEAGVPSRPPLSCRTSPPQGGRLAAAAPSPITSNVIEIPPCPA
ncbi:hypothetical protein EN852_033675 [Mesorhizobium sp. M2E.F.Ca.ET.209.01.1.1]|nr:hypothetical protein EN852_033675 [Mesorhizobium sp. M2E.F.Ca.ET.209.01.1.1]